MMINAMEVSGVEGNFRYAATAQSVCVCALIAQLKLPSTRSFQDLRSPEP